MSVTEESAARARPAPPYLGPAAPVLRVRLDAHGSRGAAEAVCYGPTMIASTSTRLGARGNPGGDDTTPGGLPAESTSTSLGTVAVSTPCRPVPVPR